MDLNCGGYTFFGLLKKKPLPYNVSTGLTIVSGIVQWTGYTKHAHSDDTFCRQFCRIQRRSRCIKWMRCFRWNESNTRGTSEYFAKLPYLYYTLYTYLLSNVTIRSFRIDRKLSSFDKIRSNIQFSTSSNSVTSAILKFTIKEVAASRSALNFILDFLFS